MGKEEKDRNMEDKYGKIIKATYDEIEKESKKILENYKRYADALIQCDDENDLKNENKNEKEIIAISKEFNVLESQTKLEKYISVSAIMEQPVNIDLRYYGRSIAKVYKIKKGELRYRIIKRDGLKLYKNESDKRNELISLNIKYNKIFKDYPMGKSLDWEKSTRENKFLKIFLEKDAKTNLAIQNEHYYESQLLINLCKNTSVGKLLTNIQPIVYAGCRLQFPTSLAASKAKNGEISLAKDKNGNLSRGGGIDILARRRISASTSRLCVMEIKDESKSNEKPEDAINQAIAYATFIDYILRKSEPLTSKKWFKIFGLGNQKYDRKAMTILVVIAMPIDKYSNKKREDSIGFAKTTLELKDIGFNIDKDKKDEKIHDNIELHYLYFNKDLLTDTPADKADKYHNAKDEIQTSL